MQWLMTSHVRRHHRRYRTSGHIWEGRFESFPIQHRRPSAGERGAGVLETEDPLLAALRYVERNPLRAGLVRRAEDWAWSSLRWWHRPGEAPGFWRAAGIWRPGDWLRRVNAAETEAELAALRRSLQRGTPYGAARSVKRVARQSGLQCTLRPRGRPRNTQDK